MATKVLVADDSKTIRKAIELTFMAKEDFELAFASSYDEMVSALSGSKPDLLIVDMGILPAGYDTLHELRTGNDGLRILAMHSIHSQFDESRKDTCHAYIAKPFLTENMIARVEEVAAMPAAPVQEPAEPESAAPKPSSPAPEPAKAAQAAPSAPSSPAAATEEKPQTPVSEQKAAVLPLKNRKTLKTEESAPAAASQPQSQEEEVLVIEAEPPEESAPAIDFTIFSKNAPAEQKPSEKVADKLASLRRPPFNRGRAQTMLYSGPPPVPGQGFPGLGESPEPKKEEPAPGVPQPAAQEKSEVTARTEPVSAAASESASQPSAAASQVASSAVDEVIKQAAQKGPEYEAIANLSREVIERIAWEVVPQLSEVIIREIIRKQGLPKS